VAAARVKQARAIAGIAEADRIPQVGIAAGAQRVRQSDVELGLPAGTPVAPAKVFNANLTASYEVDLFGRVSSNVAAARGDAASVEATYRSVLLAVQADVAQTYFRLRATDAELETLNRTVQTREENVKVNQRRFDLGDIGEFDLSRAKTELATAKAEAIGLQRQRATTEHALAVLLGKPAASYTAGNSPLLDGALLPVIPAGLPSTLLERRPDIAAAQRAMEAANARIGVARSAMFPALVLNANAGGTSANTVADVQVEQPFVAAGRCAVDAVDRWWPQQVQHPAQRSRFGRIGWHVSPERADGVRGSGRQPGRPAHPGWTDGADRRCCGVGAPLGGPGAEAVHGWPFELPRSAGRAAQPGDGGAQCGAVARQSRCHYGGADPRAGRWLGRCAANHAGAEVMKTGLTARFFAHVIPA
jgi:hypothetical protein